MIGLRFIVSQLQTASDQITRNSQTNIDMAAARSINTAGQKGLETQSSTQSISSVSVAVFSSCLCFQRIQWEGNNENVQQISHKKIFISIWCTVWAWDVSLHFTSSPGNRRQSKRFVLLKPEPDVIIIIIIIIITIIIIIIIISVRYTSFSSPNQFHVHPTLL